MAYSRKSVSKMLIEPNALDLLGCVESIEETHRIIDAVTIYFDSIRRGNANREPENLTGLSRAGEKAYSALINSVSDGAEAYRELCDRMQKNRNTQSTIVDYSQSKADNSHTVVEQGRIEGQTEQQKEGRNYRQTDKPTDIPPELVPLVSRYGSAKVQWAYEYAVEHRANNILAYMKKLLEANQTEPTRRIVTNFYSDPKDIERANNFYENMLRAKQEREDSQLNPRPAPPPEQEDSQ